MQWILGNKVGALCKTGFIGFLHCCQHDWPYSHGRFVAGLFATVLLWDSVGSLIPFKGTSCSVHISELWIFLIVELNNVKTGYFLFFLLILDGNLKFFFSPWAHRVHSEYSWFSNLSTLPAYKRMNLFQRWRYMIPLMTGPVDTCVTVLPSYSGMSCTVTDLGDWLISFFNFTICPFWGWKATFAFWNK